MDKYESISDRLKAVDLLLENEYASPAVFLVRSVVEHIVNTMLIDKGLWDKALGDKALGETKGKYPTPNLTPNLSSAISILNKNGNGSESYTDLLSLIRRFGNKAAHNSAVSLDDAIGCRSFLNTVIKDFVEKYPDEIYLRDFSEFKTPLIEVTSLFRDRTIALRSNQNSKFFSVNIMEENAPVSCTAKKADAWEYLRVRATEDSYLGFLCVNDKWLSVNDGDTLLANGENLNLWECFKIYKSGKNYCVISKKNNKWMSLYSDKKNNVVYMNSKSPEKPCNYFNIKIIN